MLGAGSREVVSPEGRWSICKQIFRHPFPNSQLLAPLLVPERQPHGSGWDSRRGVHGQHPCQGV